MPRLLRLHFTRPPPQEIALGKPFPLTISLTDDLRVPVSAITVPLHLRLLDARSHTPIPSLTLTLSKPASSFIISPTGQPSITIDVTITCSKSFRQPKPVCFHVGVDNAACVDPTEDGDVEEGVEDLTSGVCEAVGARGVKTDLEGGMRVVVPLGVYSGECRVMPAGRDAKGGKVQTNERHFRFQMPRHANPLSDRLPRTLPLVIPITEHAHMTFSTGTHIWDCAPILALYLTCHAHSYFPPSCSSTPPRQVIELGAGCGLTGITGAVLGGDVVCTDLDNPADSCLQHNIDVGNNIIQTEYADTGGKCRADILEWGFLDADIVARLAPPTDGNGKSPLPPLVIAADVLYNVASHGVFLDTITSICAHRPGAEVLVAYKWRGEGEEAFWGSAKGVFEVRRVAGAVGVGVYNLRYVL
ncbi:putative methyltransferase-domain-containing protein [Fimicolochytrium jonesii]|uniref:putative methyltransferase-domain-containing protein n=1 Tax=Fimicolochytrium jonesii TaxID=1396493 RepID=UPI0022FF32D2|nr:putative methyltransferase-domain-containing protein [Fimicolochytrium jonesii]KAI8819177.1 putative methyltransferase-domain-containing protein [Fimicolochytrium jonesii]